MRNQTFHFRKQTINYVFATFLGFTALLMSCETPVDEVLPQEHQTHANVSTTQNQDMKTLPHQELAKLRAAVARYHNIKHAIADGYDYDLTGYRSQMGHHYLKFSLLDQNFELERPELLMYIKQPNGHWRFVGVEYAVPILDMNNIPQPPEGFTGNADEWAVNFEFEVWTLHVWVGLNNPDGIFASHNPLLP